MQTGDGGEVGTGQEFGFRGTHGPGHGSPCASTGGQPMEFEGSLHSLGSGAHAVVQMAKLTASHHAKQAGLPPHSSAQRCAENASEASQIASHTRFVPRGSNPFTGSFTTYP